MYPTLQTRIYAANNFFVTFIRTLHRGVDMNHKEKYDKVLKVFSYMKTGKINTDEYEIFYSDCTAITTILPSNEVIIPSTYWSADVLTNITGEPVLKRAKIIEECIRVCPVGTNFRVTDDNRNYRYVARLLNSRLHQISPSLWVKDRRYRKKKTQFIGL